MGFSYLSSRTRIRADRRRVLYVPTNYTRTVTSTAEATDQLAAHLKGIDDAIGAVPSPGPDAYTEIEGDNPGTGASSGADTLTFTGGTGITTATASTGTVTITNDATDRWTDVATNTGTTPTPTGADTLNLVGDGTHISTTGASGTDTVTVAYVGPTVPTNYFAAATGDSGSASASGADTLDFRGTGASDATVATESSNVKVTLNTDAYTEVSGDSGTDTASGADTLSIVGGGIIRTTVSAGQVSVAANGFLSPWALGKRYFTSALTGSTTINNHQPGTGTIFYSQIFIPEEYTLDNMSVQVTSGAGLGLTVRLAIYEDVSGEPVDLIHDTGTVSASTNAVKQADVTTVTIGPGHFWMAFQASSGALGFKAAQQTQIGPYLGEKDDTVAFAQGITQRTEAQAYGAFPATAAETLTEVTTPLVLIGLSRSA